MRSVRVNARMAKPVAKSRSDEEISSSGRPREVQATQEGRQGEATKSKPWFAVLDRKIPVRRIEVMNGSG